MYYVYCRCEKGDSNTVDLCIHLLLITIMIKLKKLHNNEAIVVKKRPIYRTCSLKALQQCDQNAFNHIIKSHECTLISVITAQLY